jgi:hypothetical protein
MRRLGFLSAMVAVLLLAGVMAGPSAAFAAVDASDTWNDYAATYNFDTFPGSGTGTTFGDAYHGNDFDTDFQAILEAVSNELDIVLPPWDEEEFESSILEWPEA